jgi:hypothetical protein
VLIIGLVPGLLGLANPQFGFALRASLIDIFAVMGVLVFYLAKEYALVVPSEQHAPFLGYTLWPSVFVACSCRRQAKSPGIHRSTFHPHSTEDAGVYALHTVFEYDLPSNIVYVTRHDTVRAPVRSKTLMCRPGARTPGGT